MKQRLLLKTMLLLCALIAGSSYGWAAEGDTHDFSQTLQQLLNNNAAIASINIDAQSYPIKKVTVSYRYNKTLTDAVTIAVSVDGTSWGTANSIGTDKSYTTIDFAGTEATGAVSITFTNNTGDGTGHGTFYVDKVTLTEGNSADPGKTDVTLSFQNASYEADYNGGAGTFTAPTLSKSADVAVSYESTEESVATVNASSGAITLVGKGTTTIRASFAGDANYNNASASYELTVVDNKRYSVAEAFNIIDSGTDVEKTGVYVSGKISQIDNVDTSNGVATYWISADGTTSGNQLEVYKGKFTGNVNFTSSDQINVGDRVVVFGNLKKYSSTYEFDSNNYIVTLTADTRTAVNLTTFTSAKTTLIVGDEQATAVTNDQAGWTAAYTYSSDDESVATIDTDGKISAVGKGTTKVWATLNVDEADENYKVGTTNRKSIDITVNNPSYDVIFSVNGADFSNDVIEEGTTVTFPTTIPATLGGKAFVGWAESEITGTQDTAPATLIKTATTTMGNADITYYAVYATTGSGEADTDLTITYNSANIPTAYGDANKFTEYTLEGKKFKVQQMYKNGEKLQWRAAGNSNGTGTMYNTEALNKIQSIVLTYNSSDASKNFTVKVGSEENPVSGTNITPSVSGLKYTFDCSAENKNYFVLTNGSNAGYLESIKITYKTSGTVYTAYCTSIAPINTSITAAKYATFCDEVARDFSASGIEVYKAASDGTQVELTEIADGIVPANTGVVLFSDVVKSNVAIPVATTAATGDFSDNEMVGINVKTKVAADGGAGKTNYILSNEASGVGFYKATASGANLGAHKAYLSTANAASAPEFMGFWFADNVVTGVSDVRSKMADGRCEVYNLNGQRVAQPTKGLYIVNGKKIVIK